MVAQTVKNLPVNSGDLGLIPGSGIHPGEGNNNSLQYSYLGNPINRGGWWATVLGSKGVGQDLETEATTTPPPIRT